MKNVELFAGKLEVIKRLKSSYNGNPRYLCRVGNIEFKTAVDSSYGYNISKYDGLRVVASVGSHYNTPTLVEVMTA